MPGDDRLPLDYDQHLAPPRPESGQHNPIDPIGGSQWYSALPRAVVEELGADVAKQATPLRG